VRVASVGDFRDDFVRAFDVDGVYVAVVRHNGQYYAFDGHCTHADYSFDWTRIRQDDLILCSSHYSWFELATGKAIDGPATEDLAVYEVRVEGDDVLVDPEPVSR
jgi:nitrite reductase/ring-hydroxylating ferredoxin subunit